MDNHDEHSPATEAAKCPFDHASIEAAATRAAEHKASLTKLLSDFGDAHKDHADDPVARAFSHYCAPVKPTLDQIKQAQKANTAVTLYRVRRDELWPTDHDDHVAPWAQTAHDMLRSHILGPYFPCIGSRAAMSYRTYRVGYYRDLAHEASVLANARDLRRFVGEYEKFAEPEGEGFCTFIAHFKYPQSTSEQEFETLLFKHLQMLHDLDKTPWDPHYSPDPESTNFAFSFDSCAFFIVGMHSGSKELPRRSAYATLVFNPESQIRRLIDRKHLLAFANTVRKRYVKYQGRKNPSLPEDPDHSGGEARVFSGVAHPPGQPWQCPFKPRADLLLPPPDKKEGE